MEVRDGRKEERRGGAGEGVIGRKEVTEFA